MNKYYTYAYLRKDRTPYYIGKGCGRRIYEKRKNEIRPPKDRSRIIYLKQNLTEEEAFEHEIYMISVFGRKDIGTGILCNKTIGGRENLKNKMDMSSIHLENCKRGGITAGNLHKQNKTGFFKLSKEELSVAGKRGGKNAAKKTKMLLLVQLASFVRNR